MSNFYVVKYGQTFLVDFGQFWTRWIVGREHAQKWSSREEAELVAYAVEGQVEEVEGGVN
jgi:hypothetical protein